MVTTCWRGAWAYNILFWEAIWPDKRYLQGRRGYLILVWQIAVSVTSLFVFPLQKKEVLGWYSIASVLQAYEVPFLGNMEKQDLLVWTRWISEFHERQVQNPWWEGHTSINSCHCLWLTICLPCRFEIFNIVLFNFEKISRRQVLLLIPNLQISFSREMKSFS